MAAGQAPNRVLLLGTETVVAGQFTITGTTGAGTAANPSTHQPLYIPTEGIISLYLRGIGTISGGTILIEEADWGDQEQYYSGTWGVIATVSAASISGGVQLPYHITDTSYAYVRVRISSPLTGGGSMTAVKRSRGAM